MDIIRQVMQRWTLLRLIVNIFIGTLAKEQWQESFYAAGEVNHHVIHNTKHKCRQYPERWEVAYTNN